MCKQWSTLVWHSQTSLELDLSCVGELKKCSLLSNLESLSVVWPQDFIFSHIPSFVKLQVLSLASAPCSEIVGRAFLRSAFGVDRAPTQPGSLRSLRNLALGQPLFDRGSRLVVIDAIVRTCSRLESLSLSEGCDQLDDKDRQEYGQVFSSLSALQHLAFLSFWLRMPTSLDWANLRGCRSLKKISFANLPCAPKSVIALLDHMQRAGLGFLAVYRGRKPVVPEEKADVLRLLDLYQRESAVIATGYYRAICVAEIQRTEYWRQVFDHPLMLRLSESIPDLGESELGMLEAGIPEWTYRRRTFERERLEKAIALETKFQEQLKRVGRNGSMKFVESAMKCACERFDLGTHDALLAAFPNALSDAQLLRCYLQGGVEGWILQIQGAFARLLDAPSSRELETRLADLFEFDAIPPSQAMIALSVELVFKIRRAVRQNFAPQFIRDTNSVSVVGVGLLSLCQTCPVQMYLFPGWICFISSRDTSNLGAPIGARAAQPEWDRPENVV